MVKDTVHVNEYEQIVLYKYDRKGDLAVKVLLASFQIQSTGMQLTECLGTFQYSSVNKGQHHMEANNRGT